MEKNLQFGNGKKKKVNEIKSINEYAILTRKIEKYENEKKEGKLSKTDEKKLKKHIKNLDEFKVKNQSKETTIADSLIITCEKIEAKYALRYCNIIFPDFYILKKELVDAFDYYKKRTKNKLNIQEKITKLIQIVLDEYSDFENLTFGLLKTKINSEIETFICFETKEYNKKLKKKYEEELIGKLIINISKNLNSKFYCNKLNESISGKQLFGFLPEGTRDLLENDIYYYFRLKAIGDGNCLIHSILQSADINYPKNYDEVNNFKLKKQQQLLLNQERKEYVANFRTYLGNSINEDIFNYIGNSLVVGMELDEYKSYIAEDKRWLAISDIPIIASFLNVNIFLFTYSDDGDLLYNPVCIDNMNFDENKQTIFLYNVFEQHYESIVRIRKDSPILSNENLDENLIFENSTISFDNDDPVVKKVKDKYLLDCNAQIPHMFLKNWNKEHCHNLQMKIADDQGYCPPDYPFRKEFVEQDAVCCSNNDEKNNGLIDNPLKIIKNDKDLWFQSSNKKKLLDNSMNNNFSNNNTNSNNNNDNDNDSENTKEKLEEIKEIIGDVTVNDYGESKIIILIKKGLDLETIISMILENLNDNNESDNNKSDDNESDTNESDDEITECDIIFNGKTISVEIRDGNSIYYKFDKDSVFTKVGIIKYTSNSHGKAIWDANYRDLILKEN